MSSKTIPNDRFFEMVENEIRAGRRLELVIKGSSMYPALKDGRHKVVLAPPRGDHLRRGMVALFNYRGKHLIHRLVSVGEETLTFQGDNLPHKKEVVCPRDVIAWVERIVTPRGRVIDCGSPAYRLRSRAYIRIRRYAAAMRRRIAGIRSASIRFLGRRHGDSATIPAQKTKVLFFIESLGGGGAERILSIIAEHIDKEKFDVTVSCVSAAGVYSGQVGGAVRLAPLIRTNGRLRYRIAYNLIYRILPPQWVYRFFMPKGNDVEIAFCEGFATRLLSRSPAARKLAWVHSDPIANPWTQGAVYVSTGQERDVYSRFDAVVCVSERVRESFEKKFGIPAQTIYNPIDPQRIMALSRKERVPHGKTASARRKKRIAFVVNGLHGGGAEKILQIILRNFDRERYDVTLVCHSQQEAGAELYPDDIPRKHILKSRSRLGRFGVRACNKINLIIYDRFSPRMFRRFYLRGRFDAEIAFIEGYATRIVAGGRSATRIAWVHIDLRSNPWTDIAFRSMQEQIECYGRFDHVVSVSRGVREASDRLFGPVSSSVVYNPIETAAVRQKSGAETPQRERSVPLFVSAGRLVHQKGYDRLVRAAATLKNEGADFRIWIVGEGSDRPALEKLIGELGLENTVVLLGFRDNPYPYMAAADWFVCSSRSEGYSTVVTESLILGVPVIATDCAGSRELLGEEGQWGIVVDNDEAALTDGMRKILNDTDLHPHYSAMAAKRGDMFSLGNSMNEIYGIIDRCTANHPKKLKWRSRS